MEALPSTTISASQIRSMFKGDSQPISFGQYYKGGTSVTYGSVSHPIVPDSIYTPNVPTSGQLSFSNFRDSRKEYQIELDSDKHQYDLSSDFSSKFTTSGEADKVPILNSNVPFKITIPSGINVWSTSVSTPAFTIPNTLPSNVYTSNVVNNGKIYGQGQTRAEADAATAPGKAMDVQWTGPTYVLNYGEIKGGGGAGGNGGSGGAGGDGVSASIRTDLPTGAGGFHGMLYYYYTYNCFSYFYYTYGPFCYARNYAGCYNAGYGGGHGDGGTGGVGGTGGAGGDAAVFTNSTDSSLVTSATSGASGGSGTPGTAGTAGSAGTSASSCNACAATSGEAGASGGDGGDGGAGGAGGDGGDFGNSGTSGGSGTRGNDSEPPGLINQAYDAGCGWGQRPPTNYAVNSYLSARNIIRNGGASGSSGSSGESPGDSVYYTGSQDVTVVNNGTILPAI